MQSINVDVMSNSERLRLVTEVWNKIAKSPEPLIVPDAILDEAERRAGELRANPEIAIDEAELWRRVDG